jgi:hypothetical protein
MKIKKIGPDRFRVSSYNQLVGIKKIIKCYEIYSLQILIVDIEVFTMFGYLSYLKY